MAKLYGEKRSAFDWVKVNKRRLSEMHLEIWRYAEPAWREYRSAKDYCDVLRAEGFEVEEGSGGMPTAFVAQYGEGGPVLGTYAEYDAVPGNSQQPVPYRAPREGLHPWAAGHTDPHSMLGVAALTGVLAAKEAMSRHGLGGTIRFFGEPAEKMCGSKPVHAARGYYDGFDAFVCYHPFGMNTVAWDTQCGSYWSAVFTFECVEPEGWLDPVGIPGSASPHAAARTPGAIDALCLMYTTTKYTKEAMFPHTANWALNEFVLAAGDATSDNLPPRFSQVQYSWRSYGGGRRGHGAGAARLGRGVGQLAAARRCPPCALDAAHAQGPAPRVGPRGVRGHVGAGVLGTRRAREARLDKGRA